MKKIDELLKFLSLLKVFDANYVTYEDSKHLHGLDANDSADVAIAVEMLLIPEFFTYSKTSRDRLTNILRTSIEDSSEDFKAIFDRVNLAFDDEIKDRRAFMAALLAAIEGSRLPNVPLDNTHHARDENH